jgi:glutathione-regulated potassium-efflux system ancillary protein KefG
MKANNNKILLIFAHPAFQKSRINKNLLKALKNLTDVTFHNLYEEYPDYHINIKREQDLLLKHDIIIWHHPFYWYSCPPLLKEWIDLVLQHNFAYGQKGTALRGKYVLSVITAGGQKENFQKDAFNQYTIREFLRPFEQTTRLCYMKYLPPFVVHGTHLISDEELNQRTEQYKNTLNYLLNESDFSQLLKYEYMNDFLNQ